MELKKTTSDTKDLSSDLYRAFVNGKTKDTNLPATEAFPFLKDPEYVNKGIECHWAIFEQFCSLACCETARLVKEFNCILQRSGESPAALRSRLIVHMGWLSHAGYTISDRQAVVQLLIGLQCGAYAGAFDKLWMDY